MRTLTLLIATIMLISHNAHAADIQYEVTYDQSNWKKVRVNLQYTSESNSLRMARGANQFEDRWAKFIENVSAFSDGQPIAIQNNGDATWTVDTDRGKKVNITYTFLLDHEAYEWSGGIDGIAYQVDEALFISGRSIFLIPEGSGAIRVKFNLPDNWKIVTPWNVLGSKDQIFTVENFEELTQSGFVAGVFEQFSINRSGFELAFALCSSDIQKDKAKFQSMGTGVFDYYIKLMGGVPNIHGIENNKSLIVLGQGDQTDGEVLGKTISIILNKEGGPMDAMIARFLFAHEFFHLWNGKSIQSQPETMEWFKEGFTNYYTLKSLHEIGLLGDQVYYSVLNDLFYQRYINDPGISDIALIDGEAKHDHWGIIYGGGLFAGIAQDMIIRSESDNQTSLDQVMRELFKDYGGSDQVLTIDELESRLSRASGKDQSDFFRKYVAQPRVIPILKIEQNTSASTLQEKIRKAFLGSIDER